MRNAIVARGERLSDVGSCVDGRGETLSIGVISDLESEVIREISGSGTDVIGIVADEKRVLIVVFLQDKLLPCDMMLGAVDVRCSAD